MPFLRWDVLCISVEQDSTGGNEYPPGLFVRKGVQYEYRDLRQVYVSGSNSSIITAANTRMGWH